MLGDAKKLALAYAPGSYREAYKALLLFDLQLGHIALAPGETMLKQIKLAWWRETVVGGRTAQAPNPLAAKLWCQANWSTESQVMLVDAWERLVAGASEPEEAARTLGEARASALRELADEAGSSAIERAAVLWAKFDVACILRREGEEFPAGWGTRFSSPPRLSRKLRPLAIIAGLAGRALNRGDLELIGSRLSPLVALRLGILGR